MCGPGEVDRLIPPPCWPASWTRSTPTTVLTRWPFSKRFPGLPAIREAEISPAELGSALDSVAGARLGLVPAPCPADLLGLMGFHAPGTGTAPDLIHGVGSSPRRALPLTWRSLPCIYRSFEETRADLMGHHGDKVPPQGHVYHLPRSDVLTEVTQASDT
jgi:hypothetical protein